ncbi:uncharacterized protein LOC124168034 isoform X6 [Ischnura elegans]|uniref:uncharacterized protein LOC124168034 isoform X6 n=1 Tax=Ischnura elegans TaxID=197161 RepID=UPI001ED88D4D|nr:uncharacterized protein LOC124168034 isoform X6 [Ischnura elegans]
MCIAGSDGDDRRQDPVSASPLGTPPCFAASLPGPGVEAGATAGGDGRCRRRLRRVLPPKAKTPPAGRMKRTKMSSANIAEKYLECRRAGAPTYKKYWGGPYRGSCPGKRLNSKCVSAP